MAEKAGMFQWLEHIVTSVLGGAAGGVAAESAERTLGNLAEKIGNRIAKRALETHREMYVRILSMIDEDRARRLRARQGEAMGIHREEWMVDLIGQYLESLPGKTDDEKDNARKKELERLAELRHVAIKDRKKCIQEWTRPERSEFLQDLHGLEDDKLLQLARRGWEEELSPRAEEAVIRFLGARDRDDAIQKLTQMRDRAKARAEAKGFWRSVARWVS